MNFNGTLLFIKKEEEKNLTIEDALREERHRAKIKLEGVCFKVEISWAQKSRFRFERRMIIILLFIFMKLPMVGRRETLSLEFINFIVRLLRGLRRLSSPYWFLC